MIISAGTQVSIEYTLRLKDESLVASNVGGNPFIYTHGAQQIVPGLENELEGMQVGERKDITIQPEDAYGMVNPEAFQEVKKEHIPPNALHVGAQLNGKDPEGRPFSVRVVDIKEETVLMDFNHPLAGETLIFAVKVLDIQDAPT